MLQLESNQIFTHSILSEKISLINGLNKMLKDIYIILQSENYRLKIQMYRKFYSY